MKNILIIILFALVIFIPTSCWQGKPSKITDNVFGEYVFQYPSNEIEVLTIKSDSTYTQNIYINAKSFKNNTKPLYSNIGEWSISSEKELNFKDWLVYCYMRYPDTILPKPEYGYMADVYWIEPSIRHKGLISVAYENGYVFKHISDWENNPAVP
ncbi:hypothetical protein CJ739_1433 [Mariniflexile rhizosphaerae]|uniref:hypothetical protein n=1 Tax=unclassified Mariniflexile TaxID=2643887 RepID=UPI000CC50723|nr:hypothetical protein [Mariniflexile sp. TRM1-10]AXP80522.1 hypothetical protein CJ739_1433 [Mariniflexile sp. TRM1-10]PLB20064.1 MAG: hypothetical protein TRG1_1009 [Flavobacteriaceae bacterium FS1-H7996/R]